MASALNIHDADDQPNGTSAAEDERVIDISSPMQDVSRHDTSTKHEETTPHQDVNLQEAQAQEEGQGPTTLLGLQCATPLVMLPPSPPLTVADPREGAESEASISAVIGTSAQPQNVAITPPNMQEEDVTNWRVAMGGEQAEVRREVLEEETEGGSVCDDTIVDDGEFRVGVRLQRVTVDNRRWSVCCPPSVRDGDLREEGLVHVHGRFCDLLAQASDLADLLEEYHLALLVPVDTHASRIVASVLLPCETIDEDIADSLAVLLR